MQGGEIIDTSEPIEDPIRYPWELPMVMWSDPRLPDQNFVREHAKGQAQVDGEAGESSGVSR